MKKLLVTLFAIFLCNSAFAREITNVCANHILVPTELDAIKLKSQIKTFDDFTRYAKLYSECPSGQRGGD